MYSILLALIFYYVHHVTCSVFYDTGYSHLKQVMFEQAPECSQSIEEKWIKQPLDHFDTNSKTWPMRYFASLDFVQEGGPVYIYLGGEGDGDSRFLTFGIIKDLAEETGGALYTTEHRYYGKSRPFESTDAENMKWLSAKQALADVANLIKYIKLNEFKNSKVVVIGGSYSGNLAAWMRLKYPDLVDAAIASSGPVLAKKDFYDYLEKVNQDYARYGTPGCLNKIGFMFKRYKELLQSQEGIERLKQEMNICSSSDLNNKNNQMAFFMIYLTPFMVNSQYGGPKKINEHCSYLRDMNGNNLKEFLDIKRNCMDVSLQSFIAFYLSNKNANSWLYQQCTEFGYFQTTSSQSQPFGHVLSKDLYLELCRGTFGPEFDEARVDKGVEETNNVYGGLTPNVARVVFSNGDVDPWSTLGVLKDLSDETPAVVVHGSTHCADLFSRSGDSEELQNAYENNKRLIKKWIGLSAL